MKRKYFYFRLILVLFIAFINSKSINAQTVTITLDWNGSQAMGGCDVCGADYWCVNNAAGGIGTGNATDYQTFTDPVPAGNTITGISFTYYGTSCDANVINSYINSTYVGQAVGNYDCTCGACYAYSGSQTFSCGIPDYNYGSTNNFVVAPDAAACYDRIDITFTYTPSTNLYSYAPTSISASVNPICSGNTTVLTANGGSNGPGANLNWYSGSCGFIYSQEWFSQPYSVASTNVNSVNGILDVTSTANDPMITMYPIGSFDPATYKYIQIRYRVVSGTAGNVEIFYTNGRSAVAVGDQVVSSALISDGNWHITNIDMSVSTYWLGYGNITGWRFDWCTASGVNMQIDYISLGAGLAVDQGASITVAPNTTTNYYVLRTGTCNATTCASTTININTNSVAPTSATASLSTICSGNTTTVSVNGGVLGTGATWQWYSGSCGGTSIGSGASINVSPTTTTTYYVRAEGTCNTTTCESVTVNVTPNSSIASVSGTSPICIGTTSNYSANSVVLGGGTGSWSSSNNAIATVNSSGVVTGISVGTCDIIYTISGGCGGDVSAQQSITINSNSTMPINLSALPTDICSGDVVTITVNGGNLGTGANWELYSGSCNGTFISSNTTGIFTVTPSLTTIYYALASGTCNTTSCVSANVTVNAQSISPTSVSATNNTVCTGGSSVLSVNDGFLGTGANWAWYEGGCGNGTAIGSGTSITINPTSSTTYYVRAEGTCNTTGCASIAITVIIGANAGIDGSIEACADASPFNLFSVLGGTPDGTGVWTDSIGNAVSSTFSPSTQTSNIFIYTVSGTAPCGDDSAIVTVTVNPLPIVNFTGLNTSYCSNDINSITLTGNQLPFGTFSGVNILDLSNGTAQFTPQSIGLYTITYTYTDTNNCSANFVQSTTIHQSPNAIFIGLDTSYCQFNNPVSLIGNQSPNGNYSGIGITDNNNGSAIFTTDTIGQFEIIYAYTDINGCYSADTQIVNVNEHPYISNVTINNVTTCSAPYNGSISLIGTAGSGNYWYSINGSSFGTETIFDSLGVGNYTISIIDDNNCSSDTTIYVGGNVGFNINQINTVNLLCYEDSIGEISITTNNGILFSIDGGNTFQNDSNFHNLGAGTYYIVVLNNSGCSASDSVIITQPIAPLEYNIQINNISCYDDNNGNISTNITGGTPPYSYLWNNLANTSTISNLELGYYSVSVSDNNNCSLKLDSIYISEPDSLYLLINNSQDPFCYNGTDGQISVSGIGGSTPYSYLWNNGETSATLSNLSSGTYTTTLTDINNCKDVLTIVLNNPAGMIISANYGIDNTIYKGYVYLDVIGGMEPYTYLWSNTSTDKNQTGLSSGYYVVTISDFNGCAQSDTFIIEIPLIIPSVITPNADGKNDILRITNIESVSNVKINIFNRWGDLVFNYEGTGYNYLNSQWDGTFNGTELPMATYVYIVEVEINSEKTQYNGTVTIVR